MPMNLAFETNNPLDSFILDGQTAQPLYRVSTTGSLFTSDTTTLLAIGHDGEPVVLAEIVWKSWGSTKVTYGGQTMSLSKFLPKVSHFFSRSYWTFIAPNNREYQWKIENSALTLREGDAYIAQRHREKSKWGKRGQLSLDVYDEGTKMLDLVVLTFILAEQLRRSSHSVNQDGNQNTAMMTANATDNMALGTGPPV